MDNDLRSWSADGGEVLLNNMKTTSEGMQLCQLGADYSEILV